MTAGKVVWLSCLALTAAHCRLDMKGLGANAEQVGPLRDALAGDPLAVEEGADVTFADAGSRVPDVTVDAAAGPDAAEGDGGDDGAAADAIADTAEAGSVAASLVAFYRFDETTGTTAQDSSGHGQTAILVGGATFAPGLTSNAVTLDGNAQYVQLPNGIASRLTSFSIAAWVNLVTAPLWTRVFDFGTETTHYMFFTANTFLGGARFAITAAGPLLEQQVNAPPLPTATWQHVAVTLQGTTATIYLDGAPAAQSAVTTLTPASLGVTTRNWLGRSQFATDPYFNGQIDNFRIYDGALTAAEVQQLFQLRQ